MVRAVPVMRLVVAMLLALSSATALAAPPEAATVERQADGKLAVHWRSADPVDVLIERRATPPVEPLLVSPRDADGEAVLDAPDDSRIVVVLRNHRTRETTRVAERVLALEGGSNFRDLGGYPAANGRRVRWGLIYRSGASAMLTTADRSRIAGLGLENIIDLRSSEERVLAPSRIEGVPSTSIGYSMAAMGFNGGMESGYRAFPMFLAPHLRQIFARLLRNEGPLEFNCSAGQDRTGFTAAMILSALGTPRATIVEDYHLSTRYRHPENEMPHIDITAHPNDPAAALFARYQDDPRGRAPQPLLTADGTPFLSFAFAEIETRWGSVDHYLHDMIGLSEADIARLRTLYTE